ncbi:MAG: dipeptidase [Bacillota bacterium]
MSSQWGEMPVIDAHCDTISVLAGQGRSLGQLSPAGQLDLPRLRAGGVNVQFFALFVNPKFKEELPYRILSQIDLFYRELELCREDLRLVRCNADLAAVLGAGQIGALLAVEGGEALGGELGVLRVLHRLGVRSIILAWNNHNKLGDGVLVAEPRGLSSFGLEVVREMNRLGMLVDVSHLAEPGFWDVHRHSRKPYIVSHANCKTLCRHPRNLDDGQIIALASRGGVIGLSFVPQFIHHADPGLERLLDHVDHIASLAGADCIGWGSDFDGMDDPAPGLESPACLPLLANGLKSRGYADKDIAKIMGGNWYRVLREVLG